MKTIENIHISILFNDGSQESGNLTLSELSKILVASAIDNYPNTQIFEYLRLIFELGMKHPIHRKVFTEILSQTPDQEKFVLAKIPSSSDINQDRKYQESENDSNIPVTLQNILNVTGAHK